MECSLEHSVFLSKANGILNDNEILCIIELFENHEAYFHNFVLKSFTSILYVEKLSPKEEDLLQILHEKFLNTLLNKDDSKKQNLNLIFNYGKENFEEFKLKLCNIKNSISIYKAFWGLYEQEKENENQIIRTMIDNVCSCTDYKKTRLFLPPYVWLKQELFILQKTLYIPY